MGTPWMLTWARSRAGATAAGVVVAGVWEGVGDRRTRGCGSGYPPGSGSGNIAEKIPAEVAARREAVVAGRTFVAIGTTYVSQTRELATRTRTRGAVVEVQSVVRMEGCTPHSSRDASLKRRTGSEGVAWALRSALAVSNSPYWGLRALALRPSVVEMIAGETRLW